MARLGQDLLGIGILPRFRLVDSGAANPTGGLAQGVDGSGVVIFGADADLGRIAGLDGSLIHTTFAQFYGHELSSDYIGARTKVQSLYYPYKQFELAELTFEESLDRGLIDIVAGRANATHEFARSLYGCRFQGVADCPFELTQLVGGFPGFPYVNWGGRIRIGLDVLGAASYVKAGAFEVNPARNQNSGFDWGTQQATGYVLPVEFGVGGTDGMGQAWHAKLGGWYNSAPYSDPYFNARGLARVFHPGPALVHPGGRGGWYTLADAVLLVPDLAAGRTEGWAIFGTAGAPFDTAEPYVFQVVAGTLWTGPLAGRPDDAIGVEATYLRLSDAETGYLDGLLERARSASIQRHNEAIFELDYALAMVPGVTLTPNLQYLVNPDFISRTSARAAPGDALVVGLKLAIDSNGLLGLPAMLEARAR